MPENLKLLRGRIKSIQMTKKITRAMEMVAAAKLRKTEALMKSARPFMLKIQALLGRLAMSEWAKENPLFKKPLTGYPILVVFTSDRGLAGAFNTNILKLATIQLKADPNLKLFVIGKKGRDYLRRYFKDRIITEKTDLNGSLEAALTDEIGDNLLNGFLEGRYSRVDILYAHYVSTAVNRPTVERYLPLEADAFGVTAQEAEKSVDYILEPSPERVFEAILPRYLKSKIFIVLAETYTSEHSSRMMAMNNATKNSNELSSKLTLRLNKARQAAITTEIIEIVSGAQAQGG
ncbi:ATP synthase F1 subunit gamma [soil metagenome]